MPLVPNAASVKGWSYIVSSLKTVVETGESLPPVMRLSPQWRHA